MARSASALVGLMPLCIGRLSTFVVGVILVTAPGLRTQESTPLPSLVEIAVRLDQASAAARFDSLLRLLDEHGLVYEIDAFPNPKADEVGPNVGRNVIITIGSGDRDLVIGAHADAAVLSDGSLSHGMVDNAAAVAVLIHVTGTLLEETVRHRIQVVFFDLEELGLLGSAHFASTIGRDRVDAMVNLDIVGYGDTLIYGPAAAAGNDTVYGAVRDACANGRHECLEFDRFPPGDDRSFQAAGIPNVSLATLPRAEAHQLWLTLNAGPHSALREQFVPPILRTIHTPGDTADKFDATGMKLAYEAVLGLVRELDRDAH